MLKRLTPNTFSERSRLQLELGPGLIGTFLRDPAHAARSPLERWVGVELYRDGSDEKIWRH